MARIYVTSEDEDESSRHYKVRHAMKYVSCARCGAIGHTTENCRESLPSTDAMWATISKKIEQAENLAPSSWVKDEYGLYLPGTVETVRKSFTEEIFCFNCGEYGHSMDVCQMPTREELTVLFGDLKDMSSAARAKRKEVIDDLKRRAATSHM